MKRWLVEQDPDLAEEIFLDLDPVTGIQPGERWKEALRRSNARCEAVICLLSDHWEASAECRTEFRTAETLGKLILCARLEPLADGGTTGEWQRCDLFGEGPGTEITVDGESAPVIFLTEGLQRLRRGLHRAGIGAEHFVWPPPDDPDRAPYRGWEPLGQADAAVFFGRDGQIVSGLDALRGMRSSGIKSLFVILGPSGTGKSSFLRAGLLPRLRRDDRHFLVLDIMRPEGNALTGERGFAPAVHGLRTGLGLDRPTLGEIKAACLGADAARLRAWLAEAQQAAAGRLLETGTGTPPPTLVLPLDQAEELFSADAGPQAPLFLDLLARLLHRDDGTTPGMIVAGTIRADRYEALHTAPELAELQSVLFDELKPMPPARFKEVILGPAARATAAGQPLTVEPVLVDRLLADCGPGADTLPLLSLTLARLYRDYGGSGELTLAGYEAMGGMTQVVQTEIDSILAPDHTGRQAQLNALHSAFIPWLATINPDNDQPMRRLARLVDLPPQARPLIEALVEKRLLVKDERGGETVVEVALESLLRQWDELAGWLAADREDLKEADNLERAAAAWQQSGRNQAWLLEGERLGGAETLAAKPGFRDRVDPARDFLHASRQREEDRAAAEKQRQAAELQAAREKQEAAEAHAAVMRQRSRVLKIVLAAALVIALVAVAGFVRASFAQGEADARAREATALRLAAEGQSMLAGTRSGGEVRAIQEMLAAHALTSTAEVERALMSAVVTRRDVQKIIETAVPANSVEFSPDSRRIVSAGGNTIQLWDAQTCQSVGVPMTGHTGTVASVAFSLDGRRIVSGSWDGTVRVWDADTGRPVGEPMTGHADTVASVAFSPDGHLIVSGGNDNTVRVWDTQTGRPVGEPMTGHADAVNSVAFSPDGHLIVSGGGDNTVRVWDTQTGRPVGKPMTGHTRAVTSVAFSPDGRRIVSGSSDKTVRLWDAETGQPVGDPMTGHGEVVESVAFSPDSRQIVSGSADRTVRLWDVATAPPLIGHADYVRGVAFSPDGRRIVSGSADRTVRLWDADTGRPVGGPMIGHTDTVTSVAFSPDGRQIVSGSSDKTVRLWDAETGQPVGGPMTGHGDEIWSVAFSPDGRRIVSSGLDGTVRVWDADTGQAVGAPVTGRMDAVASVAFSPDGRRIVSGGNDGTVQLWDAETGQPVGGPMAGHTEIVTSVAFSPDGRRIVSGSLDRTVRLWDAETGGQVGGPMTGHTDSVSTVAFSPDGRRIVSGGNDGTVRLWDAETGQSVGEPITEHGARVFDVAFSPDGQRIVSGGAESIVRLWPSPASWPDALCAKLSQNFSHQQWRDWVSPNIDYIEVCPGLPIPPDDTAR